MNPTPQIKRFVGAFILLLIIAIVVPFFVTGENINKGKEAIALLNDNELRNNQEAIDKVEQMQNNVQKETQKIEEKINQNEVNNQIEDPHSKNNIIANSKDDYKEPVIVENQEDAKKEAELRRQREKEARAKAEKERKAELARQQQALREREAQLQAEKQRRIAEAKAKAEKLKAEEMAKKQNQTITVINGNTNKKTEIEVKKPIPEPIVNNQNNAPASTGGDRYTIKVGTFSSITNAKNAQAQVRGVCSAPMLKPVTIGGKRMFKVTCGMSSDLNSLRATQNKLSSIVGATALEKVN